MWNMKKVYLILHDIRSVHNVGSIFRTADCAGVEKIYLTGYTPAPTDRFGRKRKDIAKVSLGAEENIAWESIKDVQKLIVKLKKDPPSQGFGARGKIQIIALEQSKKSIDYKKSGPKIKNNSFALIVGNEVGGLSPKVLNLADLIVEIPLKGKKESLNVSVATGIALFRLLNI